MKPLGPLLHEVKKNFSRINPVYQGKTPASHTLNIRAFMTKKCENSRKYQHKSARNGLRMHHLHPFFLKISRGGGGGGPRTPTYRRGISTPASIQLRVKILPHHVYRSGALKTKITPRNWGQNQHAISKKWTQNAQFASILLKISRGEAPGPPPTGGG